MYLFNYILKNVFIQYDFIHLCNMHNKLAFIKYVFMQYVECKNIYVICIDLIIFM